ncbi:MAG: hypothetical protein MR210_03570 [Erysipelotrichaceae bacterium]|nr:hypothetical protein [Erysipelotrichaceae bacterium]MDY5251407.1 hypothetical protein [Erysipelotrichaceae bacterium]
MKVFKVLEESDFLNDFYDNVKKYIDDTFEEFNSNLKKNREVLLSYFNENEIVGLIILNKITFQLILSFFYLVENNLYVPAFNEQRSALEYLRLCRAYILDKEFRTLYLSNSNIDYRTVRDDEFMQRKILQRLKKMETDLRNMDKVPLSEVLFNNFYYNRSAFTDMHSELSKFSHGLNCNLIFPIFICERSINMGLYNDNSYTNELYIKKYLELTFINITKHSNILSSICSFGEEHNDKTIILLEMYEKYIDLFYK